MTQKEIDKIKSQIKELRSLQSMTHVEAIYLEKLKNQLKKEKL